MSGDHAAGQPAVANAWYTSTTATMTISGDVDGDPAQSQRDRALTPDEPKRFAPTVRSALFNNTTKSIVTSSNTASNHLLFTNW